MDKIIFTYKISDIQREVEKRTSYIGRMRETKETPHLLERLSLTDGEGFLFDEFLREAVNQTYDWVQAFGKDVPYARLLNNHCVTRTVKHNHGLLIKVGDKAREMNFNLDVLETDLYGEELENNSDYDVVHIVFENKTANTIKAKYRIRHRTRWTVVDEDSHELPIVDEDVYEEIVDVELAAGNSVTIIPNVVTDIDESRFGTVKGEYLNMFAKLEDITYGSVAEQFYRGDYVEEQSLESDDYKLWRVTVDTDSSEWDKTEPLLIEHDDRERIVYTLNAPEWQDVNMYGRVDMGLRESIINYIIWRWFETVAPTESQIYYDKYEKHAWEAQMALNAEKKILKRRYNLF